MVPIGGGRKSAFHHKFCWFFIVWQAVIFPSQAAVTLDFLEGGREPGTRRTAILDTEQWIAL